MFIKFKDYKGRPCFSLFEGSLWWIPGLVIGVDFVDIRLFGYGLYFGKSEIKNRYVGPRNRRLILTAHDSGDNGVNYR